MIHRPAIAFYFSASARHVIAPVLRKLYFSFVMVFLAATKTGSYNLVDCLSHVS